jgi:hypothetical protein
VGEPAFEVARFPFDDLDAGERRRLLARRSARTYTTLRGAAAIVANDPFSYDMVGSISEAGITPEGPRALARRTPSCSSKTSWVGACVSSTCRVMPIPTLVTEVRTADGRAAGRRRVGGQDRLLPLTRSSHEPDWLPELCELPPRR